MAAESKPKLKMTLTTETGEVVTAEGRGAIIFIFDDLSTAAGIHNTNAIHHGHLSSMELASELHTILKDPDRGFGNVSELWEKALTLLIMSAATGKDLLNDRIDDAEAFAKAAMAEAEEREEDSE